ncbi:hypothetical protein SEA_BENTHERDUNTHAT_96 [Gordonia phage BENtherdunthat]|uniref:Bacteriophage T5 Orf172 DNA-binding domain-containing protein n=1 Tax=Gordonia phage BENtherdunthat TaxID=2047830 RepID=A0A2H4PF49_9CAUD|nr:hypothetical protein HOS44_gp096 [Gordonia phage BENtherdunthat]ATW60866.1 hypothetical protein SEA_BENTHERDUNTHAT_96 [Gordonia phage BENtherdunthat]
MTDDHLPSGPLPPCCWPNCDNNAMWQNNVREWFLCFTHTAVALEFATRTELGLRIGDPIPVMKDATNRIQRGKINRRNTQRGDKPGWVYYARIGDHIKIGYAADVKKRMADYPPETMVLAVEPGDKKLERARHKEFAHSLLHGREWFRESYPIKKHIDEVRAKYGTDLADLNHRRKKHQASEIRPKYTDTKKAIRI